MPGNNLLQADEDLIAIWRVSKGVRFQNYRAVFTILDEGEISGDWIRKTSSPKRPKNSIAYCSNLILKRSTSFLVRTFPLFSAESNKGVNPSMTGT